jgi:ABC-type dipeptide/oligopeptide/nickel transport system permease subunit
MDMDTERKIALMHAFLGLVLGVVFGYYLNSSDLTLLSVLLIGFILSYPLKVLSMKLFNLSNEEFLLKQWLGKGYFIFITIWIMVWIFVFNLR